MPYKIILHISNEDPITADMDQLPTSSSTIISFKNPKTRDGKQINWASVGSTSFIMPLHRISFIEIIGEAKPTSQPLSNNIEFFRE